jgi:uncharacterized membrane protein YccC
MTNYRLLVVTLVGTLVAGVIASLATGNWLFLLVALAAHVVATSGVMVYTLITSPSRAEPDAVTLARIEQERLEELRRRGERITGRQSRGRGSASS